MDHGQFEREGRAMSQDHDSVDLCDNLPNSGALAVQTQNLNEMNTLTENQSVPLSQTEERTRGQKTSLNNNGKEETNLEVEQGKGETALRSKNDYEEEDVDELMREGEEGQEEGKSEGSNCMMCSLSPDTPMTDSSYSETGSLLETPYVLRPGTSPEPTSPVIPVVSPETGSLISSSGLSQRDTEVEPSFTTKPVNVSTPSITSGTLRSPTQPTNASDEIANNSSTDQITSSTEPIFNLDPTFTTGSTSTCTGPIISAAETFTSTALTELNTSSASNPVSAAKEPFTFTTGPNTTNLDFTSTASSVLSNQEQTSSTPLTTSISASTFTAGPISSPALLETLEQLTQRGDDTHLPHYLHQIAEAFVLQEDYQRALWFIQLERLYHQRVLDNLNSLQEQWESQRQGTFCELATHHLDTLKHVCQTHSRPQTRDAELASLDLLKSKFEGHGLRPSCNSDHQVETRMEQKPENSFCPVTPPTNLPASLSSSDVLDTDRENPTRELERSGIFNRSLRTEEQGKGKTGGEGEGGAGCTISVLGNGLHPSTAGSMDQSKPAEEQGVDLCQALEKEEKGEEECEVEEAAEALDMEDEGAEDEGEENQKEVDPNFCQKPIVETLVSGAELELQQLNQDAFLQEEQHDETQHYQNTQQDSTKASLHGGVHTHQEAQKQQEQFMEKEVDEDYEVYQAQIIREASTLDDMAKLITIEEISPASGLVSILKKQSAYMDTMSLSSSSESQFTPKRRVRFKVPDDGYENDVGGGDSCLLLFLLCMVTVVISVGGTALYCALGDAQSSVCQDFSRNADFYFDQIHRGIAHIQHWFGPGS